MYYVDKYHGVWMILDSMHDKLILGPFNSESDAWFIASLLQSGKLKMELESNGEEDIEDTHAVY